MIHTGAGGSRGVTSRVSPSSSRLLLRAVGNFLIRAPLSGARVVGARIAVVAGDRCVDAAGHRVARIVGARVTVVTDPVVGVCRALPVWGRALLGFAAEEREQSGRNGRADQQGNPVGLTGPRSGRLSPRQTGGDVALQHWMNLSKINTYNDAQILIRHDLPILGNS